MCHIYTHTENEFVQKAACVTIIFSEHFKSKMKFDDEYVTAARCVLMGKRVRFSGELRENYTKTGATGGQTLADGNV